MKINKITNLLKIYTLLLLSERSIHGYELIKKLESNLEKKISAGEIYPFLKSLKRNNLIKVTELGQRKKKAYTLTKKGKELLSGLLEKLDNIIQSIVKAKISTCVKCGCKIYGEGYRVKGDKKPLIFCCEACYKTFE